MKNPRLDRGPKLKRGVAQPQTMTTSGVRQLPMPGARRRSLETDVMQIPRCWHRTQRAERAGYRELMHSHGNPNRHLGESSRCNAALQISAGSSDDLTDAASSHALREVIHSI